MKNLQKEAAEARECSMDLQERIQRALTAKEAAEADQVALKVEVATLQATNAALNVFKDLFLAKFMPGAPAAASTSESSKDGKPDLGAK